MSAASRHWLLSLLLATTVQVAAALEPAAEPVLAKAQRHFAALRGSNCGEQLAPAVEFTATAEFDAGLESEVRIAFLWQLAVCAMDSRQYEIALTAAERMTSLDPAVSVAHRIRLYAGMVLNRHETAIDALQVLARADPEALRTLETGNVHDLLRAAGEIDLTGDRKLAVYGALVRAGFQPPPPQTDEFLRLGHARLLLERGRVAEAKARLATVADVDLLLAMRIERLFDGLRTDPQFEARLDLRAAMDRDLARSQAALERNPGLLEAVYRHLQNLDKAQREAEALALAEGVLAKLREDPRAFTDAERYLPWIHNELGYLLYELGRTEEGAAALREGAGLAEGNQPNVSQVINLASYLVREGRGTEALALLGQAGPASPYGRAWIESLRSCSGVLVGDEELRVQGLEYLRAHVGDNPAALSRALLCSQDVDGAAALMIRRLENTDWRGSALLALQITPPSALDELPFEKLLRERFDLLRGREDVRRAVDAVGRIETIPIDVGGGN